MEIFDGNFENLIGAILLKQEEWIQLLESALTDHDIALYYNGTIYVPSLILYLSMISALSMVFAVFYHYHILMFMENCMLWCYTILTRRIHLPKHRTPQRFAPSISFMGGGHLWMFAIGAGHYIFENFDIENIKFLASSSGCFAAVPLACGMDPYAWCHRDWAKCMAHFDSRKLGCLLDSKWFYYHLWDDYLPADAHIRCSGRLFVSITEFPSMRNKVVSHFDTREELLWVLVASMCLPIAFILDFPVDCGKNHGLCFDGGFSNDSPCLDSYTITVSALHREADIKPAMDLMSVSDEAAIREAGLKAEDVSDFDRNIRIRAIDVMRTPKFERVWQVGGIGERSAANCVDFERHEWQSIRKVPVPSSENSISDISSDKSSDESAISDNTPNKVPRAPRTPRMLTHNENTRIPRTRSRGRLDGTEFGAPILQSTSTIRTRSSTGSLKSPRDKMY